MLMKLSLCSLAFTLIINTTTALRLQVAQVNPCTFQGDGFYDVPQVLRPLFPDGQTEEAAHPGPLPWIKNFEWVLASSQERNDTPKTLSFNVNNWQAFLKIDKAAFKGIYIPGKVPKSTPDGATHTSRSVHANEMILDKISASEELILKRSKVLARTAKKIANTKKVKLDDYNPFEPVREKRAITVHAKIANDPTDDQGNTAGSPHDGNCMRSESEIKRKFYESRAKERMRKRRLPSPARDDHRSNPAARGAARDGLRHSQIV